MSRQAPRVDQKVADLAEFHFKIPRLPQQHDNINTITTTNLNGTKDA